MRDHAARTTMALLVTATLAMAGCSSGSGTKNSAKDARPTGQETPGQGGSVPTVDIPDLGGKDLGTATDTVRQLGFADIVYRDAAGKGRKPAADKNWKVCDQTPAPGPSNPKERVEFGAVQAKENCTSFPTNAPSQPAATAPTKASEPPTSAKPTTQAPTKPAPTTSRPDNQPTRSGFVFYRNCEEAKEAGAAPLHRGDPGYSRRLDKDGDGVACEK
ncbi:excalibur calcium-binding domain-containing protein [Yinghuangia sp. ASG 101]|uniref:excalibur calcium-binding domain-containing protein n=1 Tax=Yinghuangia sp. ASG 101 TaxID=2896848 RepID=UPI001E5CF1FC|nr:excalibur calcium-binding domain-containing protein [Yinghuangia sp. ASG 101]UGQ12859.1 excalibur calcium-binding domain-containing protein [Yinghuangia sp. ASG 101]